MRPLSCKACTARAASSFTVSAIAMAPTRIPVWMQHLNGAKGIVPWILGFFFNYSVNKNDSSTPSNAPCLI